ncbi:MULTISPECIES: 2-C-methyl-D-erythritol 4-phosphate cytidylyltransferase [unclassified Roseofilum]|uniref:2-C-methyl-D-erythritol 4-phosphate cytidylyltransferase n=1 Tax=unclassified Roseofilum TaxID=2620099 RepID=UPI000E8583D4|nr:MULTISPECIES: 2-C-methyl-D-erythritol 4-phosphate cytidylyltransferase [unclassified Roseofilum]HBQ99310.1 2-C-methyl-D-erythritol 4-phosphate cytidylyltransferase [Cyanobacteria bacterium UBA11691]MBP0007288.1 2-C-methyl-D-erythritol 4-phosphate cytidylyltransferase [Roseofilum sp. Belize Diploria]MBP0012531.1 2-C-methyl-D-erythritol 4-phosphate cytidylyltransferase [Roseofilum sp. SID3]MBP0024869.1 2-C-methyl-D-erythritol 4-phosphate cytidylyltransferase [Roseofilum sp. SID2]MBP0032498.1 
MHVLIPAAGMGKRMGSDRNKLLLTVLGDPLLAWTLRAAEAAETVEWIGIMGQPTDFPAFEEIIGGLDLQKPVHLIVGGSTRQKSVYNGLQALPEGAEGVLIHDGARCLVTPELFDRCAIALQECQGLIAAVPVKDTIKVVNTEHWIESTPNRADLWAAQTPQGFAVDTIKDCHEKGRANGWEVTDDAALFEQCQLPVKIVRGEETNIKVTTPIDLAIAERILQQRSTDL